MALRHILHRDCYYDSVRLMAVSARLEALPGVERAAAMMATPANRELLADAGLLPPGAAPDARPDDLLVAVRARSDEAAEAALARVDALLVSDDRAADDGRGAFPGRARRAVRSLDAARRLLPEANLALISVPGEYAAAEARRALRAGLHVMLFSDNVALDDEIRLKRLAEERGLLLMGPDCGTAFLGGVGLGFANVVRRGPVGIVAASGTGLQAVSSLVHRAGSGVSHGIGTGGRDLSDAVGGMMTARALRALAADTGTEVIVIVSKPPGARAAESLYTLLPTLGKPVVTCLLGADPQPALAAGAHAVATLDAAAATAVQLAGGAGRSVAGERLGSEEAFKSPPAVAPSYAPSQRFLRGLYAGGTLAAEAAVTLTSLLQEVYSNAGAGRPLADPRRSQAHTVVDLGADEFTRGRPHPMIDPRARAERLLQEAADPSVAVLLLDVVLGRGAHPDPAGALAPALIEARQRARAAGRELAVVAWVCGTEDDPQRLSRQERILREAGVVIYPSNAAAAVTAASLLPG